MSGLEAHLKLPLARDQSPAHSIQQAAERLHDIFLRLTSVERRAIRTPYWSGPLGPDGWSGMN